MGYYTPASFTADIAIGYQTRRIFQLTQTRLEPMFAAEGITSIQWSALSSISFGRSSTSSELARDLSYDGGAITRLVDTLEDRGWLRRTPDSHDRRVTRLTLTDEGERIATSCRLRMIESWNAWLTDWQREDVDQLIALLRKLRLSVEDTVLMEALA